VPERTVIANVLQTKNQQKSRKINIFTTNYVENYFKNREKS